MKKIFAVLAIFMLVLAGCGEWFASDEEFVHVEQDYGVNAAFIGKWNGTYMGDSDGEETLVTLDIAKDSWVLVFYYDDGNIESTNGRCYDRGSVNIDLYPNNATYSNGSTGTASLSGDTLILNTGGLLGYGTTSFTIRLKKDGSSTDGTTLTIKNESSYEITDVIWNNNDITKGSASIKSGKSKTILVQEGNGYVFFKRKEYPIIARTDLKVVVEKNEQKSFIINDNTIIVDVDNPSRKDKLDTLGVTREPQITVQVGDAPITQFGDYNFGGALLNTDRDVTFTIGNSGRSDLRFNVVEGSVINLSNNVSGYFSVAQQPFASMTIAPGSTTTFVIRFSPKAVGTNFNAEVMIKTNSEANAEFTFRVKGNGSNEYQIGDTGPGGGMIFFAQGGQYKECSGELGAYNWTNAKTTAQNYKGGGLTDWYLPDSGELDLMYQNLKRNNLGGFFGDYYWSSTADGSYFAWDQSFDTGRKNSSNKSDIDRVRAVRSFTL